MVRNEVQFLGKTVPRTVQKLKIIIIEAIVLVCAGDLFG